MQPVMEIRPLSSRYAVSPQISVEHLSAIAAAGYETVICNRPDSEVEADQQTAAIRAAAEAAGLRYEVLELTQETMTPTNVARQRALIDASDGPVLAYCRSGTRCSIVWGLGQAGDLTPDEILAATTAAGYQLTDMRPVLEQLARARD
jgi:uncharacterized protein (TIGR01244 family)